MLIVELDCEVFPFVVEMGADAFCTMLSKCEHFPLLKHKPSKIYTRVYLCVCVYIYVYTHIYLYTHTYIYSQIKPTPSFLLGLISSSTRPAALSIPRFRLCHGYWYFRCLCLVEQPPKKRPGLDLSEGVCSSRRRIVLMTPDLNVSALFIIWSCCS